MFKLFSKRPQQQTDAELVASYQESGDLEILGALYERYVDLVYGVCLKYLKEEGLAEDAVMNIFEELVTKAQKHDIQNFRPWLHVLSKNHCLMQLRKKKIIISSDPQLMQSDDLVHPNYGELTENGTEIALKNCIDKLPDEQRECITWFYLDEKSYKDIAEMTRLDLGKVRSYIQNGRRNLRNCMENATLKLKEKDA